MAYDDAIAGVSVGAPDFRWKLNGNITEEGAHSTSSTGTMSWVTSIIPTVAGQCWQSNGTAKINPSGSTAINTDSSSVERSISFWFEASNPTGWQNLYEEGGATHGWHVALYDDYLTFTITESAAARASIQYQIAADTVYHVVATFDLADTVSGQNMKLYVNGVQVGTADYTFSTGLPSHSGDIQFGEDGDGRTLAGDLGSVTKVNYQGKLQDVCYWSEKLLTSSDVADIYAAGTSTGTTLTADSITYALTGIAIDFRRIVQDGEAGAYALTGADVTFTLGLNIAVEAASYSLTGTTAALVADASITAETGSYTVTGVDPTLTAPIGTTLEADGGGYSLSGVELDFRRIVQDGEAGAYALTGADANFTTVISVAAEAGSYALTGADASIVKAGLVAAEADTYSVTGQTAALITGSKIAATAGAYTLTGIAASLEEQKATTAEAGSYNLSGQLVILNTAQIISAAPGSYTATGVDAELTVTSVTALETEAGAYALTGVAAGLRKTETLSVVAGIYSLTGTTANLVSASRLEAAASTYAVIGASAALIAPTDTTISAGAATYALTGGAAPAILLRRGDAGNYSLTGADITVSFGISIKADDGEYSVTGIATILTLPSFVQGDYLLTGVTAPGLLRRFGDLGSYTLTGSDATLSIGTGFIAEAGSYTLTGADADLIDNSFTGGFYNLTGSALDFIRLRQADSGAYILTGADASLSRTAPLIAEAATYTLTGIAITPNLTGRFTVGEYILAGEPIIFGVGLVPTAGSYAIAAGTSELLTQQRFVAEAASFSFTGADATFQIDQQLTTAQATYTLVGRPASFIVNLLTSLAPEDGEFTLSGQDADLTQTRRIQADSTSYTRVGQPVAFHYLQAIAADPASFALAGQDADFSLVLTPTQLEAETAAYSLLGLDTALTLGLVSKRRTEFPGDSVAKSFKDGSNNSSRPFASNSSTTLSGRGNRSTPALAGNDSEH